MGGFFEWTASVIKQFTQIKLRVILFNFKALIRIKAKCENVRFHSFKYLETIIHYHI